MIDLSGRVVVVTGGNSGIGLGIARGVARAGGSVAVWSRRADRNAAAVAELEGLGATAAGIQCDVGDEGNVAEAMRQTLDRFGRLDCLVANAGTAGRKWFTEMPLDEWHRVLQVNLDGAFLCLREAAKLMVKAGHPGTIVNMSSVHEFIPWPGFAHYCSSKGGMKLLMETAARELAPQKIRVVNIAPGAIVTPINQFVLDDPQQKEQVESEIPLGHMGDPENIAAAVAWAASDEASYMTGTTIVVDGGMSLYPKFV